MKIIITLEITDPETVEAYKDCHKDIIDDDLRSRSGSLIDVCEVVSVKVEE
jgi:hypothetical protein